MVFDHDYFALAHLGFFKVSQIGNFSQQSHVTPVGGVKNSTQLLGVQLRVGIGPKRDTRGMGLGAKQGIGGRIHAHQPRVENSP